MRSTFVLLVIFFSAVAIAAGGSYYRYKDENGNTVLSSSIGPEMVKQGYEVIDANGRVLEVVPPELTVEQIAEMEALKSAEQKAEEAQAKAEKEQQAYDKALLLKYSFVTDIEADKKRTIEQFQVRVAILKGNLSNLRTELEREYTEAAEADRQGKKPGEKLLKRIAALEGQVQQTETMLKKRQDEIETMEAEFDRAIKRFNELMEMRNGSGANTQ